MDLHGLRGPMYYNTTYNSRCGKRRSSQAMSHIKAVEEKQRRRELEIEDRLRKYEQGTRMISEKALQRTMMDERTDPRHFLTRKNIIKKQEFIEISPVPRTSFRTSARTVKSMNSALRMFKENSTLYTSSSRGSTNTTRSHPTVSGSSSSNNSSCRTGTVSTSNLTDVSSFIRSSKQRRCNLRQAYVPPSLHSQPSYTKWKKPVYRVTKPSNVPSTFQNLYDTRTYRSRQPISYSSFILRHIRNGETEATQSLSAPAAKAIRRGETVQERAMRVRRIMGHA